MKLTPAQLAALCVAAFGAIVAADVFIQWRGNENFRKSWEGIDPGKLLGFRKQLVEQENMGQTPNIPSFVPPEEQESEPEEEG